MARRKSKTKSKLSPQQQQTIKEKKLQREAMDSIQWELEDLAEISLMIMGERGILPPLYGGEYLENDREVIPIWGWGEDSEKPPELGLVILRPSEGIELDEDLQISREDLGIENDLPMAEIIDMMAKANGGKIEGVEQIRDMNIFLMLAGPQLQPAEGYDRAKMIDHMSAMAPYAVFPIIPTKGQGEELEYLWDDMEHFRAEVVIAESAEMLLAAVWEYRLKLAIADEIVEAKLNDTPLDEALLAPDVPSLVAIYDGLIMRALRLYGTTSPLRSRQEELDVIREENGDLIIRGPLRPEIEPVPVMADARRQITDSESDFLRIDGQSEMMKAVWPEARARKFFSLRLRYGNRRILKDGTLRVDGFMKDPVIEWTMADTLPELYRNVHLLCLFELLVVCDMLPIELMSVYDLESDNDDPKKMDKGHKDQPKPDDSEADKP